MMNAALLSEVNALPPADRLALIGAVWESFGVQEVPVTQAEKQLLDSRLEACADNPQAQSAWLETKARLRAQIP